MAKKKPRTKAKGKKAKSKKAAPSLKNTVRELRKAHGELKKVHAKATGEVKEQLSLKIQTLTEVDQKLVDSCHGTFALVPPSGSGGGN